MSSKRLLCISIVLAIALSGLVGLSPVPVRAEIVGEAGYSGSGNWNITQDTLIGNETVLVNGSIHVTGCDLTLWNVTLMANELVLEEGSTLLAKEGTVLNSTSIYLAKGNTVRFHNSTIEGGGGLIGFESDLEMHDSTLQGLGLGIILVNSSCRAFRTCMSEVDGEAFYLDRGSEFVLSGVTISETMSNSITLMSVSNARIEDSTIRYSNLSAISTNSTTLEIVNTTFEGCGDGILAFDANVSMTDVEITDTNPEACVWGGCSGPVFGNALVLLESTLNADNLRMSDNVMNVWLTNVTATIDNSNISNSDEDGIVAYLGSLTLRNSELYNNSGYAVHLYYANFAVETGNTYVANGARLGVEWYISLALNDSYGDPIRSARVHAEEASGLNKTTYTDDNGKAALTLPGKTIDNNGTVTLYSPYTLNVSRAGFDAEGETVYTNVSTVELDENKEIEMTLPLVKPDLRVVSIEVVGEPTVGQTVQIVVNISNLGEAIGMDVQVRIYESRPDGIKDKLHEESVDVAPGGYATITADWSPGIADSYNISVVIDPLGKLEEKGTENNGAFQEFSVAARAKSFELDPIVLVIIALVVIVIALAIVGLRRTGSPGFTEPYGGEEGEPGSGAEEGQTAGEGPAQGPSEETPERPGSDENAGEPGI